VDALSVGSGEELGAAIQLREEYTYGMDIKVKNERQMEELLQMSKELIDAAKEIVFGK
jgi:hypothetical protein